MDRHYASSADTLDTLAPLINKWTKGDEDDFAVAKQDAFSVELTTNSGFHYGVAPGHLFVDFRHRLKVKQRSGTVPTVEMLSEALPYTKLLGEVTDRLIAAANLISPNGQREMRKLGIVSATIVNETDAPPGISRLIDYLTAPWKKVVPAYEYQVVAVLSETDKWSDRCVHHVSRKEGIENLITIRLDYQRIFTESRRVSALPDSLRLASEVALEYFEEVALGNMFHASKS